MSTCVFTISIDDRPYIDITINYFKEYAKKINADFILIDKLENLSENISNTGILTNSNKRESIQKILSIHNLLNRYERIIFFADTVIVKEDTPNLFDIVPYNMIGGLYEDNSPQGRDLLSLKYDTMFIKKNKNVNIINYLNNGVMVISNNNKDIFSESNIIKHLDLFYSNYVDQTYINYMINNTMIYDLTEKYNNMCLIDYNNNVNRYLNELPSVYICNIIKENYIFQITGYYANRLNILRQISKLLEENNKLDLAQDDKLDLVQSEIEILNIEKQIENIKKRINTNNKKLEEKFKPIANILPSNSINIKITVVILNYYRPDNIKKIIIPELLKLSYVDNIIISHGRKETYFEDFASTKKVIHRKDFNEINEKYSVYRRFIAAETSKNNCILILDDDMIISEDTLKKLYNNWIKDNTIIHGLCGRSVKKNDFSYLSTDVYGDVPILITRCVMISLDNIKYMNSRMTQFEYFFQDCKPKWNGEDIFMSIVIMDKNNKLNKAHNFKYRNLDDNNAISKLSNHYKHRDFITRVLIAYFNLYKLLGATESEKISI